MYRMTSGPQPGIGTQLVQRTDGVGDYIQTQSYFLTPAGQAGIRGLGCGCGCGGQCSGMGLFDTGFTDVASWGIGEWAAIAIGAYVLSSVLFTTKRAAGAIARAPGERRKRKAAKYRKMAKELTAASSRKKKGGLFD